MASDKPVSHEDADNVLGLLIRRANGEASVYACDVLQRYIREQRKREAELDRDNYALANKVHEGWIEIGKLRAEVAELRKWGEVKP